MTPADDDLTPGEIRRWLLRVESDFKGQLRDLHTRVDALGTEMTNRLASLTFVQTREFEKEMERIREQANETRTIATGARTAAWACFALLVPLILATAWALLLAVG